MTSGNFTSTADIDFYIDVDTATGAELVMLSDNITTRHQVGLRVVFLYAAGLLLWLFHVSLPYGWLSRRFAMMLCSFLTGRLVGAGLLIRVHIWTTSHTPPEPAAVCCPAYTLQG
jgi:hypothetical protein